MPTPTSTTTIKKIKSSFSLNCLHPLPPTIFSSCQIHQCTHCGNRCGKSREGGTQVFKRIVVWCTHPSQLSLSFLISHPLLVESWRWGRKGWGWRLSSHSTGSACKSRSCPLVNQRLAVTELPPQQATDDVRWSPPPSSLLAEVWLLIAMRAAATTGVESASRHQRHGQRLQASYSCCNE